MSSRRSTLFQTLRLCFIANVVFSAVLVFYFVYLRSQRSKLLEVVERQLSYNLVLSRDLAHANFIITNHFFSAASSFVSNLVSSSLVNSPSVSVAPSLVSSLSASDPVSPPELPDLSFHHFWEFGGKPYVKLREKVYTIGDIVLGYPIEDISPDVVVYRGKYYKVAENEK